MPNKKVTSKKRERLALQNAFVLATGVAAGGTIGFVLIPRLTRPMFYNESWPSLALHCLAAFAVMFAAAFAVSLLIGWLKKGSGA